MLTDYALAVLAAVLGARLARLGRESGQHSVGWCSASFLITAAAAVAGGTYHGFVAHLSPGVAILTWRAAVWGVGAGSSALLVAVCYTTLDPPWRRVAVGVVAAKLAVYLAWSPTEFRHVVLFYVPDLAGSLGLALRAWVSMRLPGSAFLSAGLLVTFVGAAVQQSGVGLHRHFNHNDVYHVIQGAAVYLLYRGGRRLQDRRPRLPC